MVGLQSVLQALNVQVKLTSAQSAGEDPTICPACHKKLKTPQGLICYLSLARSCKWYNKGKLQSSMIPGELDRGNDLEIREIPDMLPNELRPMDEDPEDVVDDYYDRLYDLIPTESEENMAGPSKLPDKDDEERIEVPHPTAGKVIRMDKTVYERWRREFGAEDMVIWIWIQIHQMDQGTFLHPLHQS
ncbi:hypothetical protein SERLA73DRAFT_149318 [Serpula lacrymans var. lacrymans S7.3]|uniref:Uncharacterized protein n=1 Tax=Serpula lacrymans var. lacrymans (strain S7.3) TaxID=936435 RepID=F8PHP0_SERL3|nr:hypothetical protein SERLA73DRAFT_149318 [Serpula lacrymans var. lacrymans S7.3]